MQEYNELKAAINLCDRVLRRSAPNMNCNSMENIGKRTRKGVSLQPLEENAFYPSRTIVVQNFLPEAETHVRSFVAMFGVIEICEVFKEDTLSCVAVVQYRSKTSAANALLAMPYSKIRGCNLVVHLLWNGPYDHIDNVLQNVTDASKECSEKRVVCVGLLPRHINPEVMALRCEGYGRVECVKIEPQAQGAFAYVVFETALSAAIATFCLRNRSTSNAALMLGYSEAGSPVLLGPVRVRPLDQYPVPLTTFDVGCICSRFLKYTFFNGLFINWNHRAARRQFIPPGVVSHCVRIATTQVRGVSIFLEVVLFDGEFLKQNKVITDAMYQQSNQKYLFRFSADFGLHKPILSHRDSAQGRNFNAIRWNSFFVLDLQMCCPWDSTDPTLFPRIQSMNHIYSDLDSNVFDEDPVTTWFGDPVRYLATMASASPTDIDSDSNEYINHQNRIKFLTVSRHPFIRLVGSSDDLNIYQIPIHVYSDKQHAKR